MLRRVSKLRKQPLGRAQRVVVVVHAHARERRALRNLRLKAPVVGEDVLGNGRRLRHGRPVEQVHGGGGAHNVKLRRRGLASGAGRDPEREHPAELVRQPDVFAVGGDEGGGGVNQHPREGAHGGHAAVVRRGTVDQRQHLHLVHVGPLQVGAPQLAQVVLALAVHTAKHQQVLAERRHGVLDALTRDGSVLRVEHLDVHPVVGPNRRHLHRRHGHAAQRQAHRHPRRGHLCA
mmetsp:Transcript_25547/g.48334  ORF Transcript_25547/g.48334 Transcript_25547/m.48334 type:complete len:233 (+) Transcript_25547:1588-2286(+)